MLSAAVAGLLLELCRKHPGFYVTKRKSRREEFYQLNCALLAASCGHRVCYVAKVLSFLPGEVTCACMVGKLRLIYSVASAGSGKVHCYRELWGRVSDVKLSLV